MNRETIEALHQIEKEKSIPFEVLIEALEDALHSAYNKTANAVPFSEVEIDRETGEIHVYELIFPEGMEPDLEAIRRAEEEGEEPPEVDYSIARREEVTPNDFGRIAAQTAKQVIYQRIREAEQDIFFQEYSNRIGEIVTGIVQQSDNRYTLVDLGRVEGLLPKSEQVPTERYEHGMRVKAVIKEVNQNPKGPPIILSRRSEELVRRLFELEVPEIADGLVEIVGVAREPGYRTKISVVSHSDGVDPVGACVGPRGSRVRMVVSELRGEKIDIIPFNEEPARFVAKALSPARVREVLLDDENYEATVVVPDDQLSLAIGKDGQNARLANKLTGWKIDIKSETEMVEEETTFAVGEEEEEIDDGRCHAITSGGKRCPNAALPGSLYCGIPAHQALAAEPRGPQNADLRAAEGSRSPDESPEAEQTLESEEMEA
ncbi:MAG: transcription termination factor NusA [Thermoleophilia bacterium]